MGNFRRIDTNPIAEYKEILKNSKCEWCGQPLSRKPIIHKNKFHDPPIHSFCSKTCHNSWCYEQDIGKVS